MVRVAVLSDVHSNLPALERVLEECGEVDAIWCLGDFVGYGPWPNECIELLRARNLVAIAGNHDLAAIGSVPTLVFNPEAARAVQWTDERLTLENRQFLLSLAPMREVEGITLAHGSPRDPIWEYVVGRGVAEESMAAVKTQLTLVGHSHVPMLFMDDPEQGHAVGGYAAPGFAYELGEARGIANPGSVGQPRDRDSRAAYLLLDTSTLKLQWRRATYDVELTQRHLVAEGLPEFFADRLAVGV